LRSYKRKITKGQTRLTNGHHIFVFYIFRACVWPHENYFLTFAKQTVFFILRI